jgi:branched-chain amino acid transport system substrate-binding protein
MSVVRETILPGELPLEAPVATLTRRRSLAGLLGTAGVLLGGCSGTSSFFNSLPTLGSSSTPPQDGGGQLPPSTQQASAGNVIGAGQVKAALILPLSAGGNAGVAGQAMRNAADMALSEFNGANVQILVFDDAGNPDSARQAAQQALSQGAEIILGPLFAQSVSTVGQVARASNIPVIAFSTDANVASNGIYLLSFLPETDVERIVQYTSSVGRHSYAALIPDNPYGTVVEAAFKQAVARRNGQIVALERYPHDKAGMAGPVRNVAQVATRAEAIFIPDGGDAVPDVVQGLISNGVSTKRVQLLGTGLWDDPRIGSAPGLDGGWYAAPDGAGYRGFAERYRSRYKQDPVRTATLAYDAVALIAALVKTQGTQRFSQQVLTNPSGFTGIDGLFRFRQDGTNDRGLAVLRVTATGTQVISPAPKAFGGSGI